MITLPSPAVPSPDPGDHLKEPSRSPVRRLTPNALGWIAAGAFGALWAVAGFLGWSARPASDDYRLTVWAREGNPFEVAAYFYTTVTGRVANGFVESLVYQSSWAPRLSGVVFFAALAAALALLVGSLARVTGHRAGRLVLILSGLGMAGIAHLDQPRLYHTLFWATGAITHVLPAIALIVVVAVALRATSPAGRRAMVFAAAPLGMIIATFSEPITLAWGVLAGLGIITHLLFARRVTYTLKIIVTLTAGFAAGAAVVLLSPGHAITRQGRTKGEQLFSAEILADSYAGWLQAMGHLSANASLLAAAALGVMLSVLVGRSRMPGLTGARLVWALVAPVAAVVLSALMIMWALRVGWGPAGWTFYRGWFVFTCLSVLALTWFGFVGGQLVRAALRRVPRLARMRRMLPATLSCLVMLGATLVYLGELNTLGRKMVTRAVAWDRSDARAHRAIAKGRPVELPILPIARLARPFRGGGNQDYLSRSIAGYYGVPSVFPRKR